MAQKKEEKTSKIKPTRTFVRSNFPSRFKRGKTSQGKPRRAWQKGKRREFSAGGVVFKRTENEKGNNVVLWLITKSKPSNYYPQSVWRLPKGWLDDRKGGRLPGSFASGEKRAGENIVKNTAVREVEEEGGVKAKIVKKIGTERYFYESKDGEKILKFVTFFLMKYKGNCKKGFGFETSEIVWLDYESARVKLTHSGDKKVLDKANLLLTEEGVKF